jgi:hypothetical protein
MSEDDIYTTVVLKLGDLHKSLKNLKATHAKFISLKSKKTGKSQVENILIKRSSSNSNNINKREEVLKELHVQLIQIENQKLEIQRFIMDNKKEFTTESLVKAESNYEDYRLQINDICSDIFKDIDTLEESENSSISSKKEESSQGGKSKNTEDMKQEVGKLYNNETKELIATLKKDLRNVNNNLNTVQVGLHQQGETLDKVYNNVDLIDDNHGQIGITITVHSINDKTYAIILHSIVLVLFMIILLLIYEKLSS